MTAYNVRKNINIMIKLKTMKCKLNYRSAQLPSIHGNLPVQRKCRKIMCSYIIEPLTYLINKSFSEGIFPTERKLASVVPI